MALITVIKAPRTTGLTLLATVKREIDLSNGDDDDFINDLIFQVSSAIPEHCRRELARREVLEGVASLGKETIMVSQPPVVALNSIRYKGDLIDPTLVPYFLSDPVAGIIYCATGWRSTAIWGLPAVFSIDPQWTPEAPNPSQYLVDYHHGWHLPGDDILGSADISFASSDKSINIVNAVFPLLVAGDFITVAGSAANSSTFTVASCTDTKIIVTGTVATEASGQGIGLAVRNLPGAIERAAIETIKGWFFGRDRDWATKSERIGTPRAGGWTAEYVADDAFPPQARKLLNKFVLDV